MSLRSCSIALAAFAVAGCATTPRQQAAVQPVRPSAPTGRELADSEQVAHVLSRLTFGARPGDMERVAAMGVDRWIAEQLRPESLTDTAVVAALAPLPSWSQPATSVEATRGLSSTFTVTKPAVPAVTNRATGADSVRVVRLDSLVRKLVLIPTSIATSDRFAAGKVIRAELSERQLSEVMADFWENHFSVYFKKMPVAGALIEYDREVLRPRALGKFRDLLGAVAHSPAMLFYLDNQLSTSQGLNENYARELLELHTLGVDGGYTQHDVIEVARALTGWGIGANLIPNTNANTAPRVFTFNTAMHDNAKKVVLGHTLAAGRGIEDGEEVLDIIARHPSTAHYIATKLARRFVSDTPPAALVERAAATFTRTDGDIAEVMRTIVTSPEFFSRSAFRAKTKAPFELVVSALRAMQVPADITPSAAAFITDLGQPSFGRQTPDGWPDDGAAWMNSGALLKRVLFAADLAGNKLKYAPVQNWEGWSLASLPLDQQPDRVVRLILGGVASPATRNAIRLAAQGTPDGRLGDMVAVALGSPEFQRR
jgi:uncharacterized protein (DUF1800 family)